MKRKIVEIEESKCTGCGLCVTACHEGALQLIDGKARIVADSYCDGLGACLPACPADAIRIIERDADPFDEALVTVNQSKNRAAETTMPTSSGGCPGASARTISRQDPKSVSSTGGVQPPACGCPGTAARSIARRAATASVAAEGTAVAAADSAQSNISTWPLQIRLVPLNAPYFRGASLLVAADCTAFAAADFNARFMKGRVTLIGCPKLDEGDYSEKLGAILRNNDIRNLTVVRMEVPCCGGLVDAVRQALLKSGKMVPWQIVTVGVDGTILED